MIRPSSIVTIIACGLLMGPAPRAAKADDRPHLFGVGTANGGWTLLDPPGYSETMFDRMAQAGVTCTRLGASWANMEETRGVYDWSELDFDVARSLERGITPYCLIVNTPAWASPTGQQTHEYPPLPVYEPDFQAFCTALASRYAGQIDHWEFWNEENGYGWHEFNRADEYVPLLRLAWQALKAGNPDCMVAIGGIDDPDIPPGDQTGWRGVYFMNRVYDEIADHGWNSDEIFDAVADHPYYTDRGTLQDLRDKLGGIHAVLSSHGDGDKPIWITEYGWNTKIDGLGDAEHAQNMYDYITVLREPQFDYVTAAMSLAIGDWETGYDGWGLTDQNLRPKPVYYTFQSYPRGEAPQISHVDRTPVDHDAVEVCWRTNLPATSQVEYGSTTGYGQFTPLDAAMLTDHCVRVEGLTPGGVYHFRALATAAGLPSSTSADFTMRCADATVPNGGFEDGIGPGIGRWWRTIGRSFYTDGAVLSTVRSGDHSQAIVEIGEWGERHMDDVMYTHAAVPPGKPYTFAAWAMLNHDTPLAGALVWKVGTDPTGGEDPDAPSVVWSPLGATEDVWTRLSVDATADQPVITLFLSAKAALEENGWYAVYFDNAQLTQPIPGDFDGDADVDQDDVGEFQRCHTGATIPQSDPTCQDTDLDGDGDVDMDDFGDFQLCLSGAGVPGNPTCRD